MKSTFWHLAFSVTFLAFVGGGFWFLIDTGRLPFGITLFDLTLVVLAIMRLTRLVAYDAIFKFFRDWFDKPKGTFLGTVGELVNCPWCLGLWFGFTVTFFYFLTPYAWFFILGLAVSALASLFQILANLIGWSAEYKKLKVKELEMEKPVIESVSTSKCG